MVLKSTSGCSKIFYPKLKGPTDTEVVAAQAVLDARNRAIAEQNAEAMVQCQHCDGLNRVGDLIYIQTHWYVRPHGCTEGDYWNAGEGQFTCLHCSVINRLFGSPDVVTLKRSFKSIEKVYGQGGIV